MKVVALAGGVGGAKLAHGLAQVLSPKSLTVIGNVGDDFEHYGLHISPDLDTVMYTLAGVANPTTGWGRVDESWQMKAMLGVYGEDVWFSLGDKDVATHLLRTHWLNTGRRLTDVTLQLAQQLGVQQTILPATDDGLRTMVDTVEHGTLPFQEYFVKYRWRPTVKAVYYDGDTTARISPEVAAAIQSADLIIFCPSNPILSIAPILAVQEIRELLLARRVPSVLVSPLIGGRAIKGPTDKIMRELALEPSTLGVAQFYEGLIDHLVVDYKDEEELALVQQTYTGLEIVLANTLMTNFVERQALAQHILATINNNEETQ